MEPGRNLCRMLFGSFRFCPDPPKEGIIILQFFYSALLFLTIFQNIRNCFTIFCLQMIQQIQTFLRIPEFFFRKIETFCIFGQFPVKIIEEAVNFRQLSAKLFPLTVNFRNFLQRADCPA